MHGSPIAQINITTTTTTLNHSLGLPDAEAAGLDLLLHYTEYGQLEGRADYAATPHPTGLQDPLVDASYVYAHNPAVAAVGLDSLLQVSHDSRMPSPRCGD